MRPKVVFAAATIMLASAFSGILGQLAAQQEAAGQAPVTLTVNTQYTGGQAVTGLWTTLAQNGQVVATGFSPVRFSLTPNQQYVVTVSNYQSYIFERWDNGSTNPARAISIAQNTAITANYVAPGGGSGGGSTGSTIHMQDTTVTFGSLVYAGRQINAEYVTPSSQLVGDTIDSITLRLQRVGAPPGTFQVGVFNSDLTSKRSFAVSSAPSLTTAFQDYEFRLPAGELYTIQAGDRIGIKYNGGNSANGVSVMIDRNTADPFDGTSSYRTRYESSWLVDTGEDMYMTLKQGQAGGGGGVGGGTGGRPVANNQSVGVNENSSVSITLTGSDPDGQPIRFHIASQPAHGTLGLLNNNAVTYRPYDYYDGPDSFTFVANDGTSDSAPATVNINVANTVTKTTSTAVIITVDQRGHSHTGFWTTLSQNGQVINADYSQAGFQVNNGQQYVLAPSSGFGNSNFLRWQDNGSTNLARAISITQDTPFIAVYSN
ncbi:MAG: Ig-like domain-containing protein [Thermoproteota archaeon]